MTVVLNKVDLLKNPAKDLEKIIKGLRGVFKKTKFGADVPIIPVSANPGGKSSSDLVSEILSSLLTPLSVR